MKNSLQNLSMKKKFMVVLIPLIIIVICFDIFQIRYNYLDYKDAIRLNKAIIVSINVNHVVHNLQKERGVSSGYLASRGASFAEELRIQRNHSDSTIQAFYDEMNRTEFNDLIKIKSSFDRIDFLRRQVDEQSIQSDLMIKYYSEINAIALNTVSELINETRDKELAQQVHAIIYLLKSKEKASIERAVGIQAFTLDTLDYDMYNRLASLVASQESYIDAFLTICNDEFRMYYNNVVTGDDIDELERLRTLLFANDGFNENPGYWYNIKTNKINLLKNVEDFMSNRIHSYTERISFSSFQKFLIFLLIDIFLLILTLWLVGNIVANLIKNVSILEAYTREISSGDLSQKIHISTNDEIGKYANTFNLMVTEINKSRMELEQERNQAEYLYENIYKQSEVIFENVGQGIFLLDKEFRISNLYSKEMEIIFDDSKIAGGNLSDFMRPHLIPRDMEALEMFMQHLFNTDIDEDVVNQLNPVKQVKIFTETAGVVNTKHIRFSFSRVEREGKIQNILVTVLDETESVILQQHLEESNARKKQEMEQILSILKIDPELLRGFIYYSGKELKSISERYESNKNQDFSKLLNFTFRTIHNLKSNAVAIGLELMSDKFHKIEESIIKLQDKKIAGNDFMTILYEINEVDTIIEEMHEMFRKVAKVYNKFSSDQPTVDSNLIDVLKRGLRMMSEETGKAGELTFLNDKNIAIPDKYEIPFKDIMIQLIRNSISHGIETPSIRAVMRKLIKGTITIKLDESENGQMIVSYRDDGQGLNLEEIRKKAVFKKLISEEEARNLDNEKTVDLIFMEGFSTRDNADNISGRGQGMSLVKSIIQEHKGDFSVNFDKDRFFEMIIRLPVIQEDELEII